MATFRQHLPNAEFIERRGNTVQVAATIERHGDSRADANPDTSVSGYYYSTPDGGDSESVENVEGSGSWSVD